MDKPDKMFDASDVPAIEKALDDPFREIAETESKLADAELEHGIALSNAIDAERKRCSDVVEASIQQAAARGLNAQSPVVRILTAIKQGIENG